MSVFVYLAPPLTALGLHFFVAGERLGALQWGGVLVAFAGMLSGVVFLSEPLSASFAFAALLIAAGIALVNLRR